MRERIKLYFSLVTGLALLLFFLAGIYWISGQARKAAQAELGNYLSATVALHPHVPADLEGFVERLSGELAGEMGITVIDPAGRVAADSRQTPSAMENHRNRPEFQEAVKTGRGTALRRSGTTGQRTLYVAGQWSEGYLIRFSIPLSAAYSYAAGLLPVLLLSLAAVFALSALFASRLTAKLLRPYQQLSASLEGLIQGRVAETGFQAEYEELEPVSAQFRFLSRQLTGYVEEISAKTREVENIVGAMEEGLILLDDKEAILLINPQGARLLDLPPQVENRSVRHLCRQEAFHTALDRSRAEQKRQIADIRSPAGLTLRLYINPVAEGGTVLLVSDVSELVYLERVRSEFAANVSHELKTPLTSISGFAELIQSGLARDPVQIREYAGKIREESARLLALIQDILRLSAIEGGGVALSREPVDMRVVFAEALELLRGPMKEKGIEAQVRGSLLLRADRDRMRELALNLCENAVKYGREGGHIQVLLEEDGFQVSDDGIGIPPEHLERVFERFYRVDKARSRKTGGTGLGLSIVKHIAELYGGGVTAASETGRTTFTVRFGQDALGDRP